MKPIKALKKCIAAIKPSLLKHPFCRLFFSGALLPLGFAPFHLPGLLILGLALFFYQLKPVLLIQGKIGRKRAFGYGFCFGLGYLGFGVSWVFVSIYNYGHLNELLSGLITAVFVAYLSLFTGAMAYCYHLTARSLSPLTTALLFSALWCLSEYCRSTCFTGFPWLLLGFSQVDTSLKYLLPYLGLYGVGFLTCIAASFLAIGVQQTRLKSLPWLFLFLSILLLPALLRPSDSKTAQRGNSISVGVIQANLSMRDKWDESLFLSLIKYYTHQVKQLMPNKQLIVMPESAIPAPDYYVTDFLSLLQQRASQANTAILLGIPQEPSHNVYYNSMIALGTASGSYKKRHLVPFGEYIPKPFQQLVDRLSIPIANLSTGRLIQPPVLVNDHPIATLICYELAYPNLLRPQLPEAEWIVSISDDGWFGHSFAIYQQLQMAQALSLLTERYQIVATNDGLSSIVNTQGEIVTSLPAYQAGILNGSVFPNQSTTPWVIFGDAPTLLICLMITLMTLVRQFMPNLYEKARQGHEHH